MPLFLSDEEYNRCSDDGAAIADKADAYIADLYKQMETVKAQADAASITAEQTCSLLEQKYLTLSSDFAELQSKNSQLNSALEKRLSELAQVQSEKHQIHLQSIGKDGEIERLSTEASELHKSKRQLMELVEQKDLEIREKNATIKGYLDKIVNLTDSAASRGARLNDIEAELARTQASCARFSQEKELIERHNLWLNDELTSKVDSLIELRKTHTELEAEMSAKLADVERQFNECSSSLKWNKEKVRELEIKLSSVQEDLCSSKDASAASEEQFYAEISTVNKLVELYKESSEEWSKKAAELEGVIKALETHLTQVENDYKERLEKEGHAKKEVEKDLADMKEKLERTERELETSRKANEQTLMPISTFNSEAWLGSCGANGMTEDSRMLVPSIPEGVSGTALAASLLRDGWSLAKMYGKYQEAVDALRHEQLGRKQAQSVLERVLLEIEEKAGIILDERAEHERMVESYSVLNQKLQNSLSEQNKLEKHVQELKADLRRQERDYTMAQKEIVDLQRQVTVLLKECRDIQVRCGSAGCDYEDVAAILPVVEKNGDSDAGKIISEQLLTFTDINGLVEQNVQLRSLVRSLSDQIENRDLEIKQKFELELKRHTDDAASKVAVVLERSEEQGRMIESLHNSVAMYKRLYEEEHKLRSTGLHSAEETADRGQSNLLLLLENSQEARKKVEDQAAERLRCLEEDLSKSRNEITSLRLDRDKLALEANFAREKLDSFMKEFEHQRDESNGILARNVEFSQLIVDYQRRLRENSDSVHAAEELSRKLKMEVSVLKSEKELLLNSEKRACDEVRSLMDRVLRLQTSLDTIQATEEVREEARSVERRKQEQHIKEVEREWAEAKKELQEERDSVRSLILDRENTIKNAMRQVEDMGKELSSALQAVAAAEARAAVAEARNADLEKKIKPLITKVVDVEGDPSPSFVNEDDKDLHSLRDEMEKIKSEAQANMDHMLQYKNIAQVNEAALKQMECAHENFKIEAEKLKKSLEKEVSSLRQRVSELEDESSLKSQDAASAVSGREEALTAALAEVTALKEERSVKMSQIVAMEIQMSNLKEDLEREHQRWRTAQDNYERQVILQSETIQELTKTSEALALLQGEASELRKLADAHKNQYNELKAIWEGEKSMLEKSKIEAESKYTDINEQNKILHSRLETLHIKLAEKEFGATGMSSESTSPDSPGDAGLQNVINYLRRSKEIGETEISLLKQEKLRLQSQLESALQAAEAAQASLHAERTNSRALLFTEEEMKSLQLQVREMNLLRESNMQLREENKHNFEECQRLREVAQKTRVDIEKLEMLAKEREAELEACKKELEMHRVEKDHLEKRILELLERSKNIDVQDYDRMKDEIQEMQASLRQKDAQIEEFKNVISNKEDTIAQLGHDLGNSRSELVVWEKRVNDISQVEATLKSDVERQKRISVQTKRKLEFSLKEKESLSKDKESLSKEKETLSKERDELSRENQALSKQLEDFKQGKRSVADAMGEQALKDKVKEKEAKIQILEKMMEKQREDLKKEKADQQKERTKRLKNESTIAELYKTSVQLKSKLDDEFEKHKQAVKRLSDELERLKHAKANLPEATSAVQHLSKSTLDDLFAAYMSALESFEKEAHSFINNRASNVPAESPVIGSLTSASPSGHMAPPPAPSISPMSSPTRLVKPTEEREKRPSLPKANLETRKTGRKLIRPRLVKPEEPQIDVEMSEVDGSNIGGKPGPLHDLDTQGNLSISSQPPPRKRVASPSALELQETAVIEGEASTDASAPVLKKFRGSDSPQENIEGQLVTENLVTLPTEETCDAAAADLPQFPNVEALDAEKDEVETTEVQTEEQSEPQHLDLTEETEFQSSKSVLDNVLDKPSESEAPFDGSKDSAMEVGLGREEGELEPDATDIEGFGDDITGDTEIGEDQPEYVTTPASPGGVDDEAAVEVTSFDVLNDEKNEEGDLVEENIEDADKSCDDVDQIAGDIDRVPKETPSGIQETPSSSISAEVAATKQASPIVTEAAVIQETASSSINAEVAATKQASPSVTEGAVGEVKQASTTGGSSSTINIQQRAKERSLQRLGNRGRGRVSRGGRGARGRGQ